MQTATTATAKKPRTQGLDEFLHHSTRSGGGAYLSGWKEEGRIKVYLHTEIWSAPCWNHGVPHVIEYEDRETKDKVLALRTQRWVCHETEEILKRQYFRDRKVGMLGEREAPPVLCPCCFLGEAVIAGIRSGSIVWTEPLFKWEADGEEMVLTAGGLAGLYGKKDLSREQLRELRVAGIRRDEAWKENVSPRLQYLFCVVDAANPADGVQKAFESKGLGDKLKKAVRDEIRRKGGGEKGNPVINPFPFEWTYDDAGQFDDKYAVLAMTEEVPTAEILGLIRGPAPDVDRDLEPGNCYWLRNELEAHYIGPADALDFEGIFAGATKAGLMTPPPESKADADAESDEDVEEHGASATAVAAARSTGGGRTPEVRGAPAARPAVRAATKPPTIEIDAGHVAWKTAGWKAPTAVAFADVYLTAPDSATDAQVEAVRKACQAGGAALVAERVLCEHCDQGMTSVDPTCPHCGAAYDDDGQLLSRPCQVEGCGGQVLLEGDGPAFICGKCGATHEMGAEGTWAAHAPAATPEEEAPPPRRRRSAAAEAPPAPAPAATTKAAAPESDARPRGVPFDQPKTAPAGKAAPTTKAAPARAAGSARR